MEKRNKTMIKSEPGFTIVELIIAMAMSLVVMGAIYTLFTNQQRSYMHQERVATIQQNLRAAMYMMAREIRMAGCDPTGTASPAPGIIAGCTGGNTIQFTMDITDNAGTGSPDGDTNDPNENITYALGGTSGTDLLRNNQVMAEYISALTFTCQDLDNNGTNETVLINITAQTGGGTIDTPTPISRTLTSSIKCRNIDM
jgi:prepilin-type N-terminal cleavage/methylation domain-containing protein